MPPRRKVTERIASWYQEFRSSPGFLALVTLWIAGDFFAHYVLGWDKDWGATNLQFSIEAVYNGVFTVILLQRVEKMRKESETRHARLLKYIADMIEATLTRDDDRPGDPP